jgi:hypothetical protein
MGNSYEKKTDYYGGFQGNFLKRIDALFPDRQRVLHLFAGRVDLDRFPGDTLDNRPELEPTYCVNAETCKGVPLGEYDFVLGDPPYSESDAQRYGQCLVNRNKVVATLTAGLPVGAVIVWLDQVRPMYSKAALRNEAVRHCRQHQSPVPRAECVQEAVRRRHDRAIDPSWTRSRLAPGRSAATAAKARRAGRLGHAPLLMRSPCS